MINQIEIKNSAILQWTLTFQLTMIYRGRNPAKKLARQKTSEDSVKTDFLDAFERHWGDAELLFLEERWPNADHLYGVAAECGLKRLMSSFGMLCNDNGPVDINDRKHANEIWNRYESYRSGRGSLEYILPQNPFADWDVSDRYANSSNFNSTSTSKHQSGARIVKDLIKKAQLAGIL